MQKEFLGYLSSAQRNSNFCNGGVHNSTQKMSTSLANLNDRVGQKFFVDLNIFALWDFFVLRSIKACPSFQ